MFAIFLHRVVKKLSEFLIQNPIKRAMHKPESCIICSNKFEPSTSLPPTLIGHSLNCCIALLVMIVQEQPLGDADLQIAACMLWIHIVQLAINWNQHSKLNKSPGGDEKEKGAQNVGSW
jgi:hypothetical protein